MVDANAPAVPNPGPKDWNPKKIPINRADINHINQRIDEVMDELEDFRPEMTNNLNNIKDTLDAILEVLENSPIHGFPNEIILLLCLLLILSIFSHYLLLSYKFYGNGN